MFTNGPIAFAHRGGALLEANIGIENTMEAFANAVALGYRHIESDLQASRDGEVFCFHDDDLSRLLARPGQFLDFDASEIKQAHVGGKARVPTFAEALDAFPDVVFNIDLKHPATIETAIKTVREARAVDRVVFASFDHATLVKVRALAPEIATSTSPKEIGLLKFGLAKAAKAGGAVAVQVPIRSRGLTIVTPRFIETAHKNNIFVHVWTIDEAHSMKKLLDMGVDGLVSDRIDVLKSVLIERGQWRQS